MIAGAVNRLGIPGEIPEWYYVLSWILAGVSYVKPPAACRGASLARLEFKLRSPLLKISMMLNVL